MTATVSCPDAGLLERFCLGQASEEEMSRLEAHLSQCGDCLQTLDSLHPRDTVVEALAGGRGAEPEDHAASVRWVIEKLKTRLQALSDSRVEAPTTTGDAGQDEGALNLDFLSVPQKPDEIGRLGGYRILKLIGQGGMGLVFQAEDAALKRTVALKVMRPGQAKKPESHERFLREARAAAAIEHDHIVTIHQVGEANGVPFLAMPWLKGMSLDQRLQQTPSLSMPEIIRIGRQVASGLAAAHARGLIHRDIKPGNIWLETRVASDEGRGAAEEAGQQSSLATHHSPLATRVKILDFGLAKPLEKGDDAGNITQSGVLLGTPLYMAPEQARGEAVDARSDLFSLGVVLYCLCTGKTPFQGATTSAVLMALASVEPQPPCQLNPDVPVGLSQLIEQLLAKDPAKRPSSAGEVAQRLLALVPSHQPEAPARGTHQPEAPAREPARKPRRRLLAAAVLLLVIAGGSFGLYQLSFTTPHGTLVVEIDDPAIEARFKKGVLHLYGPDDKLLYTIKPSERNKTLPAGKYKIEVAGADGLTLDTDELTLKKNGKETVRVLLKQVGVAKETPDAGWVKQVAALPLAKQLEAVTAKLKERNPNWKGQVAWDGGTRGITISRKVGNTPDPTFTDLSPVRALTGLKRLCVRFTAVADLSPLKGMSLTVLDITNTQVTDLSPLKGVPLTHLECHHLRVTDLSVLKHLPLTHLNMFGLPVYDLTPLKGMKLTFLSCQAMPVSDLSPLRGMPLTYLDCSQTKVVDLSPLKETPVKELLCDYEAERDIDLLLSLKSLRLINGTAVTQIREEMELAKGPFDQWLKKVATLSPQKQVRAVAGRLRLDNPVRVELQKVEGGVVTAIQISGESSKVSDLTPVRALAGLKSLDCYNTAVADLSPLKGLKLQRLGCNSTQVSDLSPLKDMPLKQLHCGSTHVADLSPLKGMPLTVLNCDWCTQLADLSPLRGLPLTTLYCQATRVSDLSPLQGLPLQNLQCDFQPERDAAILRSIKTLRTINGRPAAEVLKTVPPAASPAKALDDAWFKEVAAMPPAKQAAAVGAQLKDRNPGFSGKVRIDQTKDGVIVAVTLGPGVYSARDDSLVDLAPVRALAGVQALNIMGTAVSDLSPLKELKLTSLQCGWTRMSDLTPLKGMPLTNLDIGYTGVTDLSPLQGMPLTGLVCTHVGVSDLTPLKGMPLKTLLLWQSQRISDLTPLKGMPLTDLSVHNSSVSDLSPLKGMKLKTLDCSVSKVSDLSPLGGMPLEWLVCFQTPVHDLTPLKGMKLTSLRAGDTQIADLAPLTGMPLTSLEIWKTRVTDLSPLKGMRLTHLHCQQTSISNLSPLKGMPLRELDCQLTKVSDLSPLQGMPLEHLSCDLKLERDAAILRSIKTLQTINGKPAAEVLKEAEARMPLDEGWFKQVAAMPAKQQVEAVIAKLKERNAGFDGKERHQIDGHVVYELEFLTDHVTDIALVRALTGLRSLFCRGSNNGLGRLNDLSPLKGMKLTFFECGCTQVSDLSPLKGMPLKRLSCENTRVSDLSPLLKGMPLTFLGCNGTQVTDLEPLKGMPLTGLNCSNTNVKDLSPLKVAPLQELACSMTKVSDLSPLAGMQTLTALHCDFTKVSDLSPLKQLSLGHLDCNNTGVSDLSPLKNVPLTHLHCINNVGDRPVPAQGDAGGGAAVRFQGRSRRGDPALDQDAANDQRQTGGRGIEIRHPFLWPHLLSRPTFGKHAPIPWPLHAECFLKIPPW